MTSPTHPYPAYKPSGVQWLGEVPNHWEVQRLKYAVDINPETLSEDTSPGYEFDYLDITSIEAGRLAAAPTKQIFGDAPSRARRVFRKGDTVVSTVRTYLKASYHLETDWPELIASTGFAVLRPPGTVLPALLKHLVQCESFVGQVVANSVGVAYPAISEGKLANVSLPLPPLPEQQAIVRYLDHVDGRIRRLVDAKRQLIALLEQERQAVINQAVTRGLDANIPLKPSGVDWLGDIPAHWEVRRLKSIALIRYGLGQPPAEMSDGRPLIRATDVSRGHILAKDLIYVDPKSVPKGRNAFLSEKEIIVVRSGAYTADSAIVPSQYVGAVTGYDMVVTVHKVSPDFVASTLLAKYLRDDQLIVMSTRSAQPHLNAEELGGASILLPPLSEQDTIVEYVSKTTGEIDSAIGKTDATLNC